MCDLILQIHPLAIPADAKPANYDTVVGIYDRITAERLPINNSIDNPNNQQNVYLLKIVN